LDLPKLNFLINVGVTDMKRLLLAFALLWAWPAQAATDVWLFRGWGPAGWSSGIDEIARRVRHLRGVNHVTVLNHMDTQRAYDETVTAHHSDPQRSFAYVGYSCGGNASLAVASSLVHNNITAHVIALQPSIWCGQYPATSNIHYFQDTWSGGTFGLGSYMPDAGPTHYTTFIERPNPHGAADTDVQYQRDAVFAVGAVADPSRRWLLERHLLRSAPHVDRQDANVIWRRE
jgi:hypothetical protein